MADDEKKKSTQTQSETEGGIRPFPSPPRNPHTVRIFALIVGINDYPGGIPKLNGCLKDVDQVTGYLREKFGNPKQTPRKKKLAGKTQSGSPLTVEIDGRLHLCALKDSQATYRNIVRGFREHLSHATDKDTVWFHFSGHGSEQFAAPEFNELDPNGRDQTLVCYRDENDTGAPLFLADKELAALLQEVSKNKPHIVVSLDSCHSGSGTRDTEEPKGVKPRVYPFLNSADREDPALLPGSIRTFDSYLDGYYQKMDQLDIPVAEHVLLSACESVQTAGDMARGGIFTTSLIEALRDAKGPIHYARLFAKTRARASKRRSAQNPQFETIGGFDPYTSFLLGEPMPDISNFYEVFRKGSDWYVRCGAIHGLQTGKQGQIKLMIAAGKPTGTNRPGKIGAFIEKVGAQHSKIKLAEGQRLDKEEEYFAEILAMPAAPAYVKLFGNRPAVKALKAQWDASKNILLAGKKTETEAPALSVEATDTESFIIRDAHTGKQFVEIPAESGSLARRIHLVQQNLDKIARWKRMIDLDNPNTRIRGLFEFKLKVLDKDARAIPYVGHELAIYTSDGVFKKDTRGNDLLGINFRVALKKAQQDLFLYAFDLSSGCAIKFRNDEEKVIRVANMNAGDSMPLRSSPYAWGLGPDDQGATRWFKLLVATEELDYHQLEQPGLVGAREVEMEEFDAEKISEDWCAETIKVVLVRRE